jgi:hypothetical protein
MGIHLDKINLESDIVKEKKSILEKFGLVEKVIMDGEQGFDEIEQEILTQPEVLYFANKGSVDVNTAESLVGKLEDPADGMKNKRLIRAEEIYGNYNITSQGINSLFIIESFLKALPDYLPIDVKRESLLNIISSSGVSLESLIKDGSDKLRCLKEFSQSFSDDASNTISRCENEIES